MLQPQQLAKFGLNEKEARIYLASLELGAASVQTLAEAASVHRVSAYDILEGLEQKGFIKTENRGKKRVFVGT
jgi:sugar-specific transcriptional regulator TrmB